MLSDHPHFLSAFFLLLLLALRLLLFLGPHIIIIFRHTDGAQEVCQEHILLAGGLQRQQQHQADSRMHGSWSVQAYHTTATLLEQVAGRGC